MIFSYELFAAGRTGGMFETNLKENEMTQMTFGAEYLDTLEIAEMPAFGGRTVAWRLLRDDEAGYREGVETWVRG